MPDFFLISGLFLARVIDRDWRTYLDRKVVHFVYFYLLWLTIQFAFKAPAIVAESGLAAVAALYLERFVEPFGTLWFIYLLPIFFVVTKLTRNLPPLVVWIVAAALEIAPIETGWMVIDEFASRFVYFYTGYLLAAAHLRAGAARAGTTGCSRSPASLLWARVNGALVFVGYADLPGISLALGLVGAAPWSTSRRCWRKHDCLPALRYCGEHSIVIYLAFFLPMAVDAHWSCSRPA